MYFLPLSFVVIFLKIPVDISLSKLYLIYINLWFEKENKLKNTFFPVADVCFGVSKASCFLPGKARCCTVQSTPGFDTVQTRDHNHRQLPSILPFHKLCMEINPYKPSDSVDGKSRSGISLLCAKRQIEALWVRQRGNHLRLLTGTTLASMLILHRRSLTPSRTVPYLFSNNIHGHHYYIFGSTKGV